MLATSPPAVPPGRNPEHTEARTAPAVPPLLWVVPPIGPRPTVRAATYRRRRIVAAVLAVAVLLVARAALGGLGSGLPTAPEPAPAARAVPVAQRAYVVQPGDTLWTIARSLQPSGDVRPLVDRLAAQSRGRPLRPGERVVVP